MNMFKRKTCSVLLSWLIIAAMTAALIPAAFMMQTNEVDAATMPQSPRVSNGESTWDCIYYGNYYKESSDSKTPVKWRVLSVNGSEAFLLADENIDGKILYNEAGSEGTWTDSNIRKWLNSTFINEAFTQEEQNAIKSKTIKTPDNPVHHTTGGADTTDKIFLLSISEVTSSKYGFSTSFTPENTEEQDETRLSKNTKYTAGKKQDGSAGEADSWALRSPGYGAGYMSYISYMGHVDTYGCTSGWDYYGVRPAMYLDLSAGGWTGAGTVSGKITATETEEDNKVSGEVTVTYNPQMKKLRKMEITENYSDDFFSTDNSKYNQELAEFSLLVTMASQSKWTADRSDRDAYIKSLFVDKLKFTEYFSKKYDVTLDNTDDTVGFAFAKKKIDGKNVMAIAIRSGGYGGEWESNGRVCGGAIDGEHDGFGSAAKAVFSDVQKYASENQIDKIWICGYSRGAAVSGLLGNRISESGLVSPSDLYCYTFEAPKSTSTIKKVHGIYNIVSVSDAIPMVPLDRWGFTRYGKNIYIKSTKESLKAYSNNVDAVRNKFREITGNDLKSNPRLVNELIIGFLGSVVPTATQYAAIQTPVSKCLGTMGTEQKFLDGKNEPYDYTPVLKYFNIDQIYYGDKSLEEDFNSIFQQHWPEATYAWLKFGETTETNVYKTISFIARTNPLNRTYAPVTAQKESSSDAAKLTDNYTIRVYDSDNNKVAEIAGGDYSSFADKNPDTSLEVIKGLNDEIRILVPEDDEYRFELVPGEKLTLDYEVQELQGDGELTRTIQYNDIGLDNSDKLEGKSEQGTDSDAAKYDPAINENKTVKPDVVAEGSELDAVNIETQVVGNGYAAGAGTYADQAKVTLTAKPRDNAVFGGWYESGRLISKETSFTFRAESGNDRNITAKFCEPIQGRSVKLSKTTYVYNGKSQTPAVTVSGLKKGRDYTVSYSRNKYVGTATARITGTGDYSGTITRTFRIIPKGTSIRSLSKAKKAFTVKWKKQSTQTTGYQIRYSLKSSMKSSKTVTITKNSATSKKISKLKAKKKYYIQIRSYKTVNKVRYYSSWSSTKKVTTR